MKKERQTRFWFATGLLAIALVASACGPGVSQQTVNLGNGRLVVCFLQETETSEVLRCPPTGETYNTLADRPEETYNIGDIVNGLTQAGYSFTDPWACAQDIAGQAQNRAILERPEDGTSPIDPKSSAGLTVDLKSPACAATYSPPVEQSPALTPVSATLPAQEAGKESPLVPWCIWGPLTVAVTAIGAWVLSRRRSQPIEPGAQPIFLDLSVGSTEPSQAPSLPVFPYGEMTAVVDSSGRITGFEEAVTPYLVGGKPAGQIARAAIKQHAAHHLPPNAPLVHRHIAEIHEGSHVDAAEKVHVRIIARREPEHRPGGTVRPGDIRGYSTEFHPASHISPQQQIEIAEAPGRVHMSDSDHAFAADGRARASRGEK